MAFLGGTVLERDPGESYAYSNLGAGVLGYALTESRGGYENVMRERVLVPLGMTDTAQTLTPAQQARFATGHNAELAATPAWRLDALSGAGSLRSTASDLAKYLKAAADPDASPMPAALNLAERPVVDGSSPSLRIGLGWHVYMREGRRIEWHNGRTGGFASMIAFDPATREGVVVLSNASIGVEDLTLHMLDASIPLSTPPRPRAVVKLDAAVLDRIAGNYELARDVVLTIRREGDRAFARVTGQGELEIFPESDYEYFVKGVDAQLSFVRDVALRVSGLVLRQGGRNMNARRIE
jgi:CubicO group peptidase (beta-lactamase class C family)